MKTKSLMRKLIWVGATCLVLIPNHVLKAQSERDAAALEVNVFRHLNVTSIGDANVSVFPGSSIDVDPLVPSNDLAGPVRFAVQSFAPVLLSVQANQPAFAGVRIDLGAIAVGSRNTPEKSSVVARGQGTFVVDPHDYEGTIEVRIGYKVSVEESMAPGTYEHGEAFVLEASPQLGR